MSAVRQISGGVLSWSEQVGFKNRELIWVWRNIDFYILAFLLFCNLQHLSTFLIIFLLWACIHIKQIILVFVYFAINYMFMGSFPSQKSTDASPSFTFGEYSLCREELMSSENSHACHSFSLKSSRSHAIWRFLFHVLGCTLLSMGL